MGKKGKIIFIVPFKTKVSFFIVAQVYSVYLVEEILMYPSHEESQDLCEVLTGFSAPSS